MVDKAAYAAAIHVALFNAEGESSEAAITDAPVGGLYSPEPPEVVHLPPLSVRRGVSLVEPSALEELSAAAPKELKGRRGEPDPRGVLDDGVGADPEVKVGVGGRVDADLVRGQVQNAARDGVEERRACNGAACALGSARGRGSAALRRVRGGKCRSRGGPSGCSRSLRGPLRRPRP